MSAIHGVGASTPLQKVISQPIQKQLPAQPAAQTRIADKVQLSGVAHAMQLLKAGSDIRADKVALIRQQIEAGTYETSAKLDAAIDRMMNDLSR